MKELMAYGIILGVNTFFSAFCLWAGMKLTKVDGTFVAMLLIAAISALLGLIPGIGWIVATIVMYVLICKWTDANFFPDAFLMVVVAKFLAFMIVLAIASKFL